MKQENEKYLFKKYPKLFPGGRKVSSQESLLCFGIEPNDGWFNLIDNLCECLQNYIDNDNCEQFTVSQVKEKFGQLRFYISGVKCQHESHAHTVYGIIWFAEHLSGKICEDCGKEGKLRDYHGWYLTRCEKCYQKYQKEREKRSRESYMKSEKKA